MSETQEMDSVIIERRHIHKRDGSVQIIELIDAEVACKLKREFDGARDRIVQLLNEKEQVIQQSMRDARRADANAALCSKLRDIAERVLLNCETLHPNTVRLHRAELDQLKEGMK